MIWSVERILQCIPGAKDIAFVKDEDKGAAFIII